MLLFSSSGLCHGPCIWTSMVRAKEVHASSCHAMILKPFCVWVPCSNFLNTGLSLTTHPVLASPLTGISLKGWALPSLSYTFFLGSPESSGCDFSTLHALVSLWPIFLLIRMPPPTTSSSWWGLPFLWGSSETLSLFRSLSHPCPCVASTCLCFPCSLCIAFWFLMPSLKENWACPFLVSLLCKNEFPGGSCHFYLVHCIPYSHPT